MYRCGVEEFSEIEVREGIMEAFYDPCCYHGMVAGRKLTVDTQDYLCHQCGSLTLGSNLNLYIPKGHGLSSDEIDVNKYDIICKDCIHKYMKDRNEHSFYKPPYKDKLSSGKKMNKLVKEIVVETSSSKELLECVADHSNAPAPVIRRSNNVDPIVQPSWFFLEHGKVVHAFLSLLGIGEKTTLCGKRGYPESQRWRRVWGYSPVCRKCEAEFHRHNAAGQTPARKEA